MQETGAIARPKRMGFEDVRIVYRENMSAERVGEPANPGVLVDRDVLHVLARARIALEGRVRRRQAGPGEGRQGQLDGASSNRQRDEANESRLSSESNHAIRGLPDSHKRIARKPGQSLKGGKWTANEVVTEEANPP